MRIDSKANRVALSESYIRSDEISGGLPVLLVIESTSICNLECIMCPYSSMTREKKHMSMTVYERLIEEASEFVDFIWLHMFGEPLLNKNIYKMIDMAEDVGIRTGLSTNTTPLTEKAGRAILDSKLSLLLVSMDGSTKEGYETIRAGARFELVEGNVARFAKLKRNSSNKNLKAVLSIIDMKPNQGEIADFIRKWTGKGFDNVCVKPYYTWADQDARIVALGPPQTSRSHAGACYELWTGFSVLADGRVVSCCSDYDGRQVVGDLRTQTVREIWNGPQMRALRRGFTNESEKGALCKKCPFPHATADQVRGGNGPFNPIEAQLGFYTHSQVKR